MCNEDEDTDADGQIHTSGQPDAKMSTDEASDLVNDVFKKISDAGVHIVGVVAMPSEDKEGVRTVGTLHGPERDLGLSLSIALSGLDKERPRVDRFFRKVVLSSSLNFLSRENDGVGGLIATVMAGLRRGRPEGASSMKH